MNELELIIRIYECLGIDLNNKSFKRCTRKVFSIVKNLFFPLFLHINVILIQVLTHKFGKKISINYATFLDLITYLLSCVLWWSIYNQRNFIRLLIQSISQVNNRYKLENTLIYFIIGGTIYWSAIIASLVIVTSCDLKRSSVRSDINVSSVNGNASFFMSFECRWIRIIQETLSHAQQLLMPFLFAILYFSICFNVIKILDYYKSKFVSMKENCDRQMLHSFLKEYVVIIKYVDKISEIFSLPLLWFVWNVMCNISLVFLDILSVKQTFFHIIDTIISTVSIVGMIAVLSFCADKLLLKICIFKKALYDFKADRLFKNNLELIDIIDIVLNWETLSITVFRMIQFDRCFLFNSIAAIVAHSVIYYQLTDKEKTESANACSCL